MLSTISAVLIAASLTALLIPSGIILASKLGICPPLYLQVGRHIFFIAAWRSRYSTRLEKEKVAPQYGLAAFPYGAAPVSTAVAFIVLIVCVGDIEMSPAKESRLAGNVTAAPPHTMIFDREAA